MDGLSTTSSLIGGVLLKAAFLWQDTFKTEARRIAVEKRGEIIFKTKPPPHQQQPVTRTMALAWRSKTITRLLQTIIPADSAAFQNDAAVFIPEMRARYDVRCLDFVQIGLFSRARYNVTTTYYFVKTTNYYSSASSPVVYSATVAGMDGCGYDGRRGRTSRTFD
jgi:hypothetical protein